MRWWVINQGLLGDAVVITSFLPLASLNAVHVRVITAVMKHHYQTSTWGEKGLFYSQAHVTVPLQRQ